MPLQRTSRMQPALGLNVGGVGFFRRVKCAEPAPLLVGLDASHPAAAARVHTDQTAIGADGLVRVLGVASTIHHPQVAQPVVVGHAVDMVDLAVGPLAVNVQPSKSVHGVLGAIDSNDQVTIGSKCANDIANFDAVGCSDFSGHQSRLGIVIKKFAQTFCGKIGLSHDAVLSLCGQRPGGVSAPSGLRHFNTEITI
jgi:hypothetical protein